ncbi:PAS domain-containing sensor histidine kinase [Leptospira levettii]|uniref:ATP-binding protein n=1 Tax=Leptospira levettii TaxID=2023178 RepID=UPI000C2A9BE4|nr:ATP-binding protein [Leptospira levettii]MCW7474201.1 ATP-binding protein [Leptospira levettii]PJZ38537.1 PAS domain-containing sensor histidine kinase [Leptospira levettii]PJZ90269.1 PAS domain-containing sensor histidine kinase [Leptospira levettii]PKA01871.1 PAS domain-containing sensor histidine kinase [Leptospira levettii]
MLETKIHKLSELLSHSSIPYLFVDLKSQNVLYCHDQIKNLLGLNFTLPCPMDLIFEDSNKVSSLLKQRPNQKENYQIQCKKVNLETLTVSVQFSSTDDVLNGFDEIYILYIQWKQITETVHLPQNEGLEIPFLITDSFGKVQFANTRFLDFFSITLEQIQKKSIFDLLTLPKPIKSDLLKSNIKHDIDIHSGLGEKQKFQLQSFVTPNYSNGINNITILLLDLSTLQNAENTIRYGEEKLKTFFATINNGFVIVNQEAIIIEVAPIFKFLLFQLLAFEVGENIFQYFDVSEKNRLIEVLNLSITSQTTQRAEFDYSLLGEDRTFEIKFIPVRKLNPNDKKVMLVFSDITEAKRLDRQLIESMKFASIGEIAAGLAHEINNPLQSALLYLEDLITVDETDPNERKNILQKIEAANLRIRDLVKALLDLGRMESPNRDFVSPYYILVRTSELVEVSCRKKNIQFTRHAGPNLPGIFVRWQEIEQVLINCVVNSINALSEMEIPRENPRIELGIDFLRSQKKDWVVFSVEDNGPGIDDDTLEKVFLPLFTTRRNKQGTGLGLSISKKIIAEHGGEIYIKTKNGVGTKVEIFLPAHADENG